MGGAADADDSRNRDGSPVSDTLSSKPSAEEESAPLLQAGFNRPASVEVAVDIGSSTSGSLETCPAHRPACSVGPEQVIGTCRICFEQETPASQDPHNPLICPCLCSGSSKYVHRQCLQQWRETNHRADAYYQCEVCKYRYRYQRLWWASVLGNQVTLLVMFTLLMTAFIAVLGFIPITDRMFQSSSSSSTGGTSIPYAVIHILNGVVMLGIVGLVMSVLLLAGRVCGLPAIALFPDTLWCPCVWCLELNGNSAPLLGECMAASGGECCIALGAVLAVVMLVVGIIMAAYMLYIVLWLVVQAGLGKAQHMVENVQQDAGKEAATSSKDDDVHV